MWIAFDNEALYFAAKYYDTNPDSIMARLVRRDFIWGDPSDGCVLYLDPFHDKRNIWRQVYICPFGSNNFFNGYTCRLDYKS